MNKLIKTIRDKFSHADDTPEIIDDIFKRHTDEELVEIFHTNLEILADTRGIGYFEAFVEYIRNAGVNVHSRTEVEAYLCQHGLCEVDIAHLTDKLFEVATRK